MITDDEADVMLDGIASACAEEGVEIVMVAYNHATGRPMLRYAAPEDGPALADGATKVKAAMTARFGSSSEAHRVVDPDDIKKA